MPGREFAPIQAEVFAGAAQPVREAKGQRASHRNQEHRSYASAATQQDRQTYEGNSFQKIDVTQKSEFLGLSGQPGVDANAGGDDKPNGQDEVICRRPTYLSFGPEFEKRTVANCKHYRCPYAQAG